MTFGEIIPDILNDKAIRRKCWEEKECIFINGVGSITIKTQEGYLDDYIIDDTDLKADDWEVYVDREYFDFQQALEYMEQGKKVRRKDRHDIDGIKFVYLNGGSHYTTDRGIVISLNRPDIMAKDWYLVEEE